MSDISVANTTTDLSGKTLVTAEGDRTITGLLTYQRGGGAAPFAVQSGAALVTNLDADKIDGLDSTYFTNASNLASGTVATARLGSGSASSSTFLRGDSTWVSPSAQILDKSTTEQTVSNSAAVTSVYSFSVPANTLSTNKALAVRMTGRYQNNSGVGDSLWIRVQYGGTTILGAVSAGGTFSIPASSANWRSVELQFLLSANGATNSQRVAGLAFIGAATATETDWGSPAFATAMHSGLAIDSTANQTLDISIQMQTASANIQFKRFAVIVALQG